MPATNEMDGRERQTPDTPRPVDPRTPPDPDLVLPPPPEPEPDLPAGDDLPER